MPVFNPSPQFLREALESVVSQLYPMWELCVADDASTDPEIAAILQEFRGRDPRIKVAFRDTNGHIAVASNSAIQLATGDFVALLDHDDVIPAHALYMVAAELNVNPDADIIYSDEDTIDQSGNRNGPYFKTDWNQQLFLGHNFVNHLGVYRTSLVRSRGGFRAGLDGSQDYDLVLRLLSHTTRDKIRHIPRILYHWRIGEGVSTFSSRNALQAESAARRAITEYLEHRGERVEVVASAVPHWNRVLRQLPPSPPSVSVVLFMQGGASRLRSCVESILRNTSYPNVEILVPESSASPLPVQRQVADLSDSGILRVVECPDLSGSSTLNRLVAQSRSSLLCFVGSDCRANNGTWLQELVLPTMQPEVGIVGPKICYTDDTIAHAGMILGLNGIAGFPFRGLQRSDSGYYGFLQLVRCVSCVSPQCMLIRKDVFAEVGGFDDQNLLDPVMACVDLCLKVTASGYDIVWTPHSELYVWEGDDDRRRELTYNGAQGEYLRRRWGTHIDVDRFYNQNLSIYAAFSLAWPPRTAKSWKGQVADFADQPLPAEVSARRSNNTAKHSELLRMQQELLIQRLSSELLNAHRTAIL